ncbi:MAG TPA: helix-turn-helix transcriptional regulator [Solirubrobacterales bacterium]|nr:helix-turn-helix transcriptional regulator [Solirubrobacterales bacterium]
MDEGVGARLREARSRRRVGLPEVEAAIKIRGRFLRAIESEDWDQLPGDTYTRAFIRTYGNYLGLDGERLAEEHRRGRGAARPGERLPRVDPLPRPATGRPRRGGPRISPGLVTALVVALVVAALLVIGLSSGGDSREPGTAANPAGKAQGKPGTSVPRKTKPVPAGHSLELAAKAEVWVCLLDGKDRPLVNGLILAPGEAEGPFRSGSFTLALGNGAVTMTVDGKQQNLPEPASPIGFRIGADGKVSEIPEGERPTCT